MCTCSPRRFVGHPPECPDHGPRATAVVASGSLADPRGWDVVLYDVDHGSLVVLAWRRDHAEAVAEAGRLASEGPPSGRFVATRHPGPSVEDPIAYQVTDSVTGHSIHLGPDAPGALEAARLAEADSAPPEAHAAIDAILGGDDALFDPGCESCRAEDDGVRLTLAELLDSEAGRLERSGVLGAASARYLAALMRSSAATARMTSARTLDELFDREAALSR